jgi:hypothetical protein
MASVLGSLAPFAVRYSPVTVEPPVVAAAPRGGTAAAPAAPAADPETLHLLSRAALVLAGKGAGLTLTELRVALGESSDAVQKAIALGLRERQLRRLGSRNTLRYVGNGATENGER